MKLNHFDANCVELVLLDQRTNVIQWSTSSITSILLRKSVILMDDYHFKQVNKKSQQNNKIRYYGEHIENKWHWYIGM